MPGHHLHCIWQYDPTLHAPPRYKRSCGYDPFIPDPLAGLNVTLEASVMGTVSEAERAIGALNTKAGPALSPLARLLLRTESIASSKVEGLQIGVRELARAEARSRPAAWRAQPPGKCIKHQRYGPRRRGCGAGTLAWDIVAIHAQMMAPPNAAVAGVMRTQQELDRGTTTIRAARLCPTSTRHCLVLADLCGPSTTAGPAARAGRPCAPSSKPSTRSPSVAGRVARWCKSSSSAGSSRTTCRRWRGARDRREQYIAGLTSSVARRSRPGWNSSLTTAGDRAGSSYLMAVRALQGSNETAAASSVRRG